MHFTTLTAEEYASATRHSSRLFLAQLPEYGQWRTEQGDTVDYVGVREGSELRGVALITYQPWKKLFTRAIITNGPTLDWEDAELVDFFFTELKGYLAAKKRVIALRITPNVPAAFYTDTDKMADSALGTRVTAQLSAAGFQRVAVDPNDPADIHFIYTKDIAGKSFEEIADSLTKTMRRQVKHVGRYGVEVRTGGVELWETFHQLYESSRERTEMAEISDYSAHLYTAMMEKLGPERAFLAIAYAHPATYLEEITANIARLDEQIAQNSTEPHTRKKAGALKELGNQRASLVKQETEARDLAQRYGTSVPFAGVLAFRWGDELVQLLRGFNKDFTTYNRDYPVESTLLRWAAAHDISTYNTLGISGIFDESAPDYPVLEYKRKLNGNVEEFIGTFALPLRPEARLTGALL
ncbi:lipid II:glycine glycyltransferase FemX [Actinotignum sanguinis]|uniref:Peptidoglycan bridge formation glycyltransferase FemA/FemB family protein n=1 Tax=Schaalia turicensis TaxID=131111 RepID=A0ABZ0RKJ2_9ACTO|nr:MULTISPECIES: peptidoglycan bridge formation glycyltransferase FemA/FemB family protein [Actinotignum]WPJ89456.1 peptidoglycan bridge formation glycyltransferase FemA/FemB family protein [Schaalia turicensis]MDE1552629.1 peptidoglycan bridge formation glycyltransferase FemA/FemB family protein [Actinotignum sanguinis]MDE1653743.1 peptidoglycan bridge formation glycyltransferase FemA/FemB family protein [Actinotignum schaalii]MDK7196876.1 peptidoglycan bridge formation glycyltransferase FemA/